jgi:hypothetical protein
VKNDSAPSSKQTQVASLGPMFMGTFVQYYLLDRVQPAPGHV